MEAFEKVVYEALYEVMGEAWDQAETEYLASHAAPDAE